MTQTPQRRLHDGSPAEPTEPDLNHIRSDASGLNPIPAGIALMLEISDFTSVLERIVDRQSVVEIEDTSQAPSSGLAATFSPGAREKGRRGGEGTGGRCNGSSP